MQKPWTTALTATLLLPLALVAAPSGSTSPEEAVTLYDAGKYAEARVMLEALDAESKATGPLLYRLAFTLGRTGDPSSVKAMEDRALTTLEKEFAAGGDIEVAFYLSNAYRNRNDPDRSVQVALAACKQLESGEWPAPETALNRFRAGKLYEDQDREEEAENWYRQALSGFEKQGGKFPSYEKWVRRYLLTLASERENWEDAAELLRAHVANGQGTREEYDLLAVMLSRSGRWEEAGETWRTVEQMDPAQANRPRYCRNLTNRALEVGSLPLETLDGEPIAGLQKERMETILKELVERAVAAKTGTDPGEARKTLAEIKPVFTAVALEYAYQGHSIRETAFKDGYAPLIFHADRWEFTGP